MAATPKNPKARLRSLRARAAANRRYALQSAQERKEGSQKMRDGFWSKMEAEVDPDGLLPPQERRARAVQLWRSRMDDAKASKLAGRRGKRRAA